MCSSDLRVILPIAAVVSLLLILLSGLWIQEIRLRSARDRELAVQQEKLEASNRELKRALLRAEAASGTKSAFLANMSHELRTPLNAILGFSEMIMKQMLGPGAAARYSAYARDIHDSGRHLLSIVSNILDVSKIESGKMNLEEETIDVAELIDESLPYVAETCRTKGIELRVEPPAAMVAVIGDRLRLRQVLINLLSNAAKFTGADGRITVAAEIDRDGRLVIEVADTGIGMSAEEIPLALEEFTQLDNSMVKRFEGTGIGLPLANKLVEMHGGSLRIESAKNIGTQVFLTLPAGRVVDAAEHGAPLQA